MASLEIHPQPDLRPQDVSAGALSSSSFDGSIEGISSFEGDAACTFLLVDEAHPMT